MTSYSYVTFDISPHQRTLRRGLLLLDEIDRILSFWIIPGINPTSKFVHKRVSAVQGLSSSYLRELEMITHDDSYLTEFDIPEGGEYVGYIGMMDTQERVKKMTRIFRKMDKLANRGKRATIRYTAIAVRNHARAAKKSLAHDRRSD